jgi:hypothetical protein
MDEQTLVIRNGRVLGGLEPTRAFGDARYKWPQNVQEMLDLIPFLKFRIMPLSLMRFWPV